MMTKKFLIPFVLASLVGHALVLVLTTRIDWEVTPPPEQKPKVIAVELKAPLKKVVRRAPRRKLEQRSTANSGGIREGTATLQGETGPYRDYLFQVRRKIEQLWTYPPQAIAAQEEGNAEIRFTIDANGSLSGYDIIATSGSAVLDQGALAVVKAAAPYAPLPAEYNLSRLHITATFSYRMGN